MADQERSIEEKVVHLTQKEYDDLLKDSLKLQALENGGVDNWTWYGEAMEEYHGYLKDHGYED